MTRLSLKVGHSSVIVCEQLYICLHTHLQTVVRGQNRAANCHSNTILLYTDTCPFERMAQTLCVIPDLERMERQIDRVWSDILENGNGDMKSGLINFEEFQRGIMCLDLYFPPIVISENDFKHVEPFCDQNGYVGGRGFQV